MFGKHHCCLCFVYVLVVSTNLYAKFFSLLFLLDLIFLSLTTGFEVKGHSSGFSIFWYQTSMAMWYYVCSSIWTIWCCFPKSFLPKLLSMEGWQHLRFFLLSSIHTFEEPFRGGARQQATTSAESDNKGLRIIFLCIKYRSSPLVGIRDSLNDGQLVKL